ncbi:MAG: peptidase inhibitor family I36 protein [Pseudonocardiaceae bacterium]
MAFGSIFVTAGTAHADDYCPGGYVCFWKQNYFQGGKAVYGASNEGGWWIIDTTNYRSIKNHFDNRAVWTAQPYQPATCTNPGTNRNAAPAFSAFYVGAPGSRC